MVNNGLNIHRIPHHTLKTMLHYSKQSSFSLGMAAPGDRDLHNGIEAEHQAAPFLPPNGEPVHAPFYQGWLHPYDPYNIPDGQYPSDDEEEEEDPEEDPEEDDGDAPGMEIDEESDEEYEVDDQVREERDEEGPVYETDDGEDLIVLGGNYPERSMDDPTTPISFGTFRDPRGLLWKRTPRKSIPRIPTTHFQQPPIATSWDTGVRIWNPRNPNTTEVGESSRSSQPSTTNSDHSTPIIAELERRIAQLEAQLAITIRQIESVAGQNHITGTRVRILEENRDSDSVIIANARIDQIDARVRLTDVEEGLADLQAQIEATEALRNEGRSV